MTLDFAQLDDALKHWATISPDAAAVSMLGEKTNYAELNAMADRLASKLLSNGIQMGDRIIICTKKSAESIAAIHSILRVGAVYVPIDMAAPKARMEQIIASVEPACIIADNTRLTVFDALAPNTPKFDMIDCLANGEILTPVITQRHKALTSDKNAYILMTSGTTGTPKGILHTHKSGLAYAKMAKDLCALSPEDNVSHHTPLHFDMSIFDIFSTILAGATIVIIPEMHTKFPASLTQLTEDEAITVLYVVPFALIQMVERGVIEKRDFSKLRIVMFAGEKMPPAPLYKFAQYAPKAQFLNAYGPTETNHCTTMVLSDHDIDGQSTLPIGHPSHGVSARIGDGAEEMAEGELLISTDQTMQGYWNDTQQNELCFVDLVNPSSGDTQTYYRTNDIVTRRADGALMLIGRKDRQIKLRGFRIELDEVELTLANCKGVSEAVVMANHDQLTAFVTGPKAVNIAELHMQATHILPPYAVPSKIHWLDQMLRTSTGKIDRKGLQEKYYD